MKLILLGVTFLALVCSSNGDALILKSGRIIYGEVLRRDDQGVLIKLSYGTFTYPSSVVKEVHQEAAAPETVDSNQRILPWGQIIVQLAKQEWASELKQIPATVIDVGNLRHVPYVSFQCAYTYELNIYGDPDRPAGVEMGVRRHLLTKDDAKQNCLKFVAAALQAKEDRERLNLLNMKEGTLVLKGLTFEVTPPTAEDSYGGWWISVYSKELLDKARASQAELAAITEQLLPEKPRPAGGAPITTAPESDWSKEETKLARPVDRTPPRDTTLNYAPSSGGGRVYVRSYHRKDGTYVRGHTRKR